MSANASRPAMLLSPSTCGSGQEVVHSTWRVEIGLAKVVLGVRPRLLVSEGRTLLRGEV